MTPIASMPSTIPITLSVAHGARRTAAHQIPQERHDLASNCDQGMRPPLSSTETLPLNAVTQVRPTSQFHAILIIRPHLTVIDLRETHQFQ